jgi:N-acyl amino acid synthase of PEP-CTERM/exosortase system
MVKTDDVIAGAAPLARSPFDARVINREPHLLEAAYRLRYQVYCVERGFLSAGDYPDGLEIDEFDAQSVQVGAVNAAGLLAGTARIVDRDLDDLPLFRHCTMFPHEREIQRAEHRWVEISRLAVSRSYNRRHGDAWYGLQGAVAESGGSPGRSREQRGRGGEVVVSVLKGCYQASRRMGATHWIVATERSLQRLLAQYGFTFRVIGPQSDYFGPVAPYLMDLREFEGVIRSHRVPELDDYLVGVASADSSL